MYNFALLLPAFAPAHQDHERIPLADFLPSEPLQRFLFHSFRPRKNKQEETQPLLLLLLLLFFFLASFFFGNTIFMYFNALKSFFSPPPAFLVAGWSERERETKHKTEEHYIIQILSTSYHEPLQKTFRSSFFFFCGTLRRRNIKNSLMMRKKFPSRIIRTRSFPLSPRKSQSIISYRSHGELLSQIRKRSCDVLIERLIKFLISGNCSRLTTAVN